LLVINMECLDNHSSPKMDCYIINWIQLQVKVEAQFYQNIKEKWWLFVFTKEKQKRKI